MWKECAGTYKFYGILDEVAQFYAKYPSFSGSFMNQVSFRMNYETLKKPNRNDVQKIMNLALLAR